MSPEWTKQPRKAVLIIKNITMRTALKNQTYYGFKLNKMNDQTYTQRRKVMDIIYKAKQVVELPRIEVRIISDGDSHTLCGYAHLYENIVHINEAFLNDKRLEHIVLHEILHAVLGIEHDENCYLMNAYIPNQVDTEKLWYTFKKYFNKVN